MPLPGDGPTAARDAAPGATRQRLEQRLRTAVAGGGLSVHFQPIVALPAGRVVEFEALARWTDPELGSVSPDVFIPVAESVGLIDELGRWVLERSCAQAVTWQGPDAGDAPAVAVNVSAVQLADLDFAAGVEQVLADTGLEPSRLCLEITESVDVLDLDAAVGVLARLRRSGVRTALDDFGTGRAALSVLRALPLDVVKIDRSFVAGLDSDATDAVMVRALIDTAHHLGLEVCAEGVERPEQASRLVNLGTDRAQGWLFGRPNAGATAPPTPLLGAGTTEWQGTDEFVLVVDRAAQVGFVSASARGVLGEPVPPGSSALDLVHPDDQRELASLVVAAAQGGYVEATLRCLAGDPEARWLRVRAQAFVRPGTPGSDIVLTCRDVTDRIAALTDAAVLDHVLREAMGVVPVAIAVSDLDGRILRTNGAFAAMLGRSVDEVTGSLVETITHPDDRAQDRVNLQSATDDQQRQRVVKRYLHADGRAVRAVVQVRVVTNPSGRASALVALVESLDG